MVSNGGESLRVLSPFFLRSRAKPDKTPAERVGGIARAKFIMSYAQTFHGATNTPA